MNKGTRARLMLAAAVASGLSASKGFGQVLYEPFNYTGGAQLDSDLAGTNKNFTTSGTFWSQRGTQAGLFKVDTSGLGAPTPALGVPPLPPTMGNGELFPTGTV